MTPNDTEWLPNRRQQALIDKLASYPYPKLNNAARDLEIPIDTAKRWHILPGFKAALQSAYARSIDDTKDDLERRVHALSDASVAALTTSLTTGEGAVKLRAAQIVLERILGKPTEHTEVTGKDGEAVAHSVDWSGFSDDEIRRFITRAGGGGKS